MLDAALADTLVEGHGPIDTAPFKNAESDNKDAKAAELFAEYAVPAAIRGRVADAPFDRNDLAEAVGEAIDEGAHSTASKFVDGAVRSVCADTPAARSRRVVSAIEILAANLVNQQLDTACVIDRCIDFLNDSSKVVALYDFYPEQMLWIPWRSGTGRNAKVVGGLLLERQQQW